jgi:hypothetical protein
MNMEHSWIDTKYKARDILQEWGYHSHRGRSRATLTTTNPIWTNCILLLLPLKRQIHDL